MPWYCSFIEPQNQAHRVPRWSKQEGAHCRKANQKQAHREPRGGSKQEDDTAAGSIQAGHIACQRVTTVMLVCIVRRGVEHGTACATGGGSKQAQSVPHREDRGAAVGSPPPPSPLTQKTRSRQSKYIAKQATPAAATAR